jgi:predicted Zn-ribbon and HTH transcriptional regulator
MWINLTADVREEFLDAQTIVLNQIWAAHSKVYTSLTHTAHENPNDFIPKLAREARCTSCGAEFGSKNGLQAHRWRCKGARKAA